MIPPPKTDLAAAVIDTTARSTLQCLESIPTKGVVEAMNWDDLRIFLAVSREKTLSAASKVLNVSHTTVSRRLGAFEKSLDTQLFERLPDGFVLTEEGQRIHEAALRMEQEVHDVERFLLGRDQDLSGPLRISTPLLMYSGWLYPHLQTFHQHYPHIEIQMIASGDILSLAKREVDVALRFTIQPPNGAIGRKFPNVQTAVYGARDYLTPLLPHTPLQQLNWVGLYPQENDADEGFIQRYLPGIRVAWRLSDSNMMYQAVADGLGISRLPCLIAEHDPRLMRLTDLPITESIPMWLLTHRDIRSTARVRCFLDFITACIERDLEALQRSLQDTVDDLTS